MTANQRARRIGRGHPRGDAEPPIGAPWPNADDSHSSAIVARMAVLATSDLRGICQPV